MVTFLSALLSFLRGGLMPRMALALENAALRQQLAAHLRTSKRARLRASDRVFWVLLRRLWPDWLVGSRTSAVARRIARDPTSFQRRRGAILAEDSRGPSRRPVRPGNSIALPF